MSIVKLRIAHDGICTAVPEQLWELGDKSSDYAVVFSDRKPRHTTGVYKFVQGADPRYIHVIGPSKAARKLAAEYNGSEHDSREFYLLCRARAALWGNEGAAFGEAAVPLKGYVWAEEV